MRLEEVRFAHESERRLAELFDFYSIDWEYEPVEFALDWAGDGTVTMAFRPDFYLAELDLYIELTTLRQALVTRKNRKVRRMRELYPEVPICIVYQRDFASLLASHGLPLVTAGAA